jgi:hypothetical protein
MIYYLEKLKPIDERQWEDPEVDTFTWVRAIDLAFDSITEAREFVDAHCDPRLSYRVTDGERIWSV